MPLSYRDVLVHAIQPLTRDRKTQKLRFAVPGKDHPAKCIEAVADLPDCEMTLVVFERHQDRESWKKRLLEGQGDYEFIESHSSYAMLELRLDRPRRPGSTLNEVIALTDLRQPTIAAAFETVLRDNDPPTLAELQAVWEARWAKEIAMLRQAGFSVEFAYNRNPWNEQASASDDQLRFTGFGPDPEGYPSDIFFNRHKLTITPANRLELTFHDIRLETRSKLRPGYLDQFRKEVVKLGLSHARRTCRLELPHAAPLRVEDVADLKNKLLELNAAYTRIERQQEQADEIELTLANKPLMALLSRALAGCPPMTVPRGVAHSVQLSPRSGLGQNVGGQMAEARSRGLIEPKWSGVLGENERCTVYGLTELGRAFAERDMAFLEKHFSGKRVRPEADADKMSSGNLVARIERERRFGGKTETDPVSPALEFCDPSLFAKTRHALALQLAAIEGDDLRDFFYRFETLLTGMAHGMAAYDRNAGIILTDPEPVLETAPASRASRQPQIPQPANPKSRP